MHIYGEDHSPEERDRIESEILKEHAKSPYKFLLSEELGPHSWRVNELGSAIANKEWAISDRSLHLAKKMGIPAIGIDTWDPEVYQKGVKHSFKLRERTMMDILKKYEDKHVAVIVGDTHLRTISTPELGPSSPLHNLTATIQRSRNPEIA